MSKEPDPRTEHPTVFKMDPHGPAFCAACNRPVSRTAQTCPCCDTQLLGAQRRAPLLGNKAIWEPYYSGAVAGLVGVMFAIQLAWAAHALLAAPTLGIFCATAGVALGYRLTPGATSALLLGYLLAVIPTTVAVWWCQGGSITLDTALPSVLNLAAAAACALAHKALDNRPRALGTIFLHLLLTTVVAAWVVACAVILPQICNTL